MATLIRNHFNLPKICVFYGFIIIFLATKFGKGVIFVAIYFNLSLARFVRFFSLLHNYYEWVAVNENPFLDTHRGTK